MPGIILGVAYFILASVLLNNYYEVHVTEEIASLDKIMCYVFPFSTPAEVIRYLIIRYQEYY